MNIVFIPVRGGSKSIPLKNIKILNGKPLVWWTAKAANDAECIDKVVIATDSPEIKDVVLSFKLPKIEVYDREPENASDTASTESVMLEYIQKSDLKDEDLFFLVQATSPMLKSVHIDGMYNAFQKSGAESMFTGVREKQFHWCATHVDNWSVDNGDTPNLSYTSRSTSACNSTPSVPLEATHVDMVTQQVAPINYDYRNRPRRQDFEGLIAENGACYINSVGNIKRDKCRLSEKIAVYELPSYTAYEIDEEADWIIVETLMEKLGLQAS